MPEHKLNYLFVLKQIQTGNVYHAIMYITLFTNEHIRLRVTCLYDFTVYNGGPQNTKIIGNT